MDEIEISREPIRPIECLRAGWELIRDQYLLFVVMCVLAGMISSALAIVLWGPIVTGLFYALLRKTRNRRVELSHLFKGFDLFGKAFLTYLLQVLILMGLGLILFVPVVLLFIAMVVSQQGAPGQPPNPGLFLTLIALYVFAILALNLANVFFVYSFPLLIDRGLEPVAALRVSAAAVWRHLWSQLGLMILSALLILVGFAFCCVGALLVLPITYAAEAVAYRRMFPDPPPREDDLDPEFDEPMEGDSLDTELGDDAPPARFADPEFPHGFRSTKKP